LVVWQRWGGDRSSKSSKAENMTGSAVRIGLCATFAGGALALNFSNPLHAQTAAINDLRGKIFDAKMAQQGFAGGLPHCSELDGTNFYFEPRDRVLNLDDYKRSLDSLVLQHVFNPETKQPWNQTDADARWAQVKKLAVTDQANCALVASLPDLQKQLDQLRQHAASAPPGAAPLGAAPSSGASQNNK
jgi:hypothetical protein